jgi:hypothetical protein
MRNLHELDRYRRVDRAVVEYYGNTGDAECGMFEIPSPVDRAPMTVIASADEGWDHVSVSRRNRTPNYPEMQAIYRMFFAENEVAMQLHVPATDHVNVHPNCLHLWRPWQADIPLPPSIFVGPK